MGEGGRSTTTLDLDETATHYTRVHSRQTRAGGMRRYCGGHETQHDTSSSNTSSNNNTHTRTPRRECLSGSTTASQCCAALSAKASSSPACRLCCRREIRFAEMRGADPYSGNTETSASLYHSVRPLAPSRPPGGAWSLSTRSLAYKRPISNARRVDSRWRRESTCKANENRGTILRTPSCVRPPVSAASLDSGASTALFFSRAVVVLLPLSRSLSRARLSVALAAMSLEGFLKKQGVKGPRKTFKKRWFVLKDDNKIYYYEKKNDTVEKGFIDLTEGSFSFVVHSSCEREGEGASVGGQRCSSLLVRELHPLDCTHTHTHRPSTHARLRGTLSLVVVVADLVVAVACSGLALAWRW